MPLGIDSIGLLVDLARSFGFQQDFDRFLEEQVEPLNEAMRSNAEALGQIGNTTQMADQSYKRALGLTEQYSDQNRQDVLNQGRLLSAQAEAGLRSRGLTGSTIMPSVLSGINNATNAELRRVNDSRLDALLGVEGSFTGQRIAANQFAQQANADALANQYLVAPAQPLPFLPQGRRFGGG